LCLTCVTGSASFYAGWRTWSGCSIATSIAARPSRHGGTATASANMQAKLPYPRWRRADRGALKDPEAVMVELAEYAAPVILLAVVFVLASTRPAR
jgi:hypothetical protein